MVSTRKLPSNPCGSPSSAATQALALLVLEDVDALHHLLSSTLTSMPAHALSTRVAPENAPRPNSY